MKQFMTIVLVLATTLLISHKSNANEIFVNAYGDSFEMSLIQKNGSGNDLTLNISNDFTIADIVQDGNNNTVNITTSGSNPHDIVVNQTGDNFGITVIHSCGNPNTTGYCTISVTQY